MQLYFNLSIFMHNIENALVSNFTDRQNIISSINFQFWLLS